MSRWPCCSGAHPTWLLPMPAVPASVGPKLSRAAAAARLSRLNVGAAAADELASAMPYTGWDLRHVMSCDVTSCQKGALTAWFQTFVG